MATGDPSEHLRQVGFIYQPAVSTAGFLNQACIKQRRTGVAGPAGVLFICLLVIILQLFSG